MFRHMGMWFSGYPFNSFCGIIIYKIRIKHTQSLGLEYAFRLVALFKNEGTKMAKKSNEDILISDSGVKTTKIGLYTKIFVAICRILSVILIVLGLLAFVSGNF